MLLFSFSAVPRMIQSATRTLPDKLLPDTNADFKQDLVIPNTAGKVAVEASDDLDEVSGDSMCNTLKVSSKAVPVYTANSTNFT